MTAKKDALPRARHPQNSFGFFYVQEGECMGCGVPETMAPDLMSHDKAGYCYFSRQPATRKETGAAILGVSAACCGAVRYGGRDREIAIRLAEEGLADRCDHPLADEPEAAVRNHVCFNFGDAAARGSRTPSSQPIMEYFADAIAPKQGHASGLVLDMRNSKAGSSFRYEWRGASHRYNITFILESCGERDWLLRLCHGEASSIAFAIWVHKAIEADARFQNARWYTEKEWKQGGQGRVRPY